MRPVGVGQRHSRSMSWSATRLSTKVGEASKMILRARQAGNDTAGDPVLAPSRADQPIADLQVGGDVYDRPAGLEQIQYLPSKLRRVPMSSMPPSDSGFCDTRIHYRNAGAPGA